MPTFFCIFILFYYYYFFCNHRKLRNDPDKKESNNGYEQVTNAKRPLTLRDGTGREKEGKKEVAAFPTLLMMIVGVTDS